MRYIKAARRALFIKRARCEMIELIFFIGAIGCFLAGIIQICERKSLKDFLMGIVMMIVGFVIISGIISIWF